MRYDNPELREILAAEYVLGTLPGRTRRRFERLMADDATLARSVADWTLRFEPIDHATRSEPPPPRVWRAIERRILAPAPVTRRGWPGALALWRGLALAASAALVAVGVYAAMLPAPPAPTVVAVLADGAGAPSWIALVGPRRGEVSISALRPLTEGTGHSFELWGISGGPPRPLGLLWPQPARPFVLSAGRLPAAHGVLAVSLEPRDGSPTGLPTGPVLYQGKILNPLPRRAANEPAEEK